MFHDVIHQIAIKFPIDPVLKTTFVRPRLDGKPWRHPLSFFFRDNCDVERFAAS